MSADLFALFDAPVPAPSQPQQTAAPPASRSSAPAADPFSFLQPSAAPARPQGTQQTAQWPLQQSQPATGNIWGDLTGLDQPVSSPQAADVEDDGWGDFETPAQISSPQPAPVTVQPPTRPTTRVVRAPTLDLMTNNLLSLDASPQPPKAARLGDLAERPSWESAPRQSAEPQRRKIPDPNVLFDADDFDEGALPGEDDDDDDDFGDFEAPAPVPRPPLDLLSPSFAAAPPQPAQQAIYAPPSQLLSALSLGDSAPSAYPVPPKSPSFRERNPFPGLGLKTPVSDEFPTQPKPRSPSPVTAWPTFEAGDETKSAAEKNSFEADWGAVDSAAAAPPHVPAQAPSRAPAAKPSSDWDWDDWDKQPTEAPLPLSSPAAPPPTILPNPPPVKSTSPPGPPPTNIPPPSILLSIFPSLITLATPSLLVPLSTASPSVKSSVLSSPATLSFLSSYLALVRVSARILSGRRLRWNRDRFLRASMTIAPAAAAGGKGGRGMKLAGIDKTQTAREDAEAADLLAAWGAVVGRLRAVVAGVNHAAASTHRQLRVPELGATMRVETLGGGKAEGQACVVCGLRREERVAGVDVDVEDSFGEWWVEFWGHRECRNFWVEHEVALRSR